GHFEIGTAVSGQNCRILQIRSPQCLQSVSERTHDVGSPAEGGSVRANSARMTLARRQLHEPVPADYLPRSVPQGFGAEYPEVDGAPAEHGAGCRQAARVFVSRADGREDVTSRNSDRHTRVFGTPAPQLSAAPFPPAVCSAGRRQGAAEVASGSHAAECHAPRHRYWCIEIRGRASRSHLPLLVASPAVDTPICPYSAAVHNASRYALKDMPVFHRNRRGAVGRLPIAELPERV